MPDQPMHPAGDHNPRNNPRQHKRPTRRRPANGHPGASHGGVEAHHGSGAASAHPGFEGAQQHGAHPGADAPAAAPAEAAAPVYPAGHDAASQEAAARAAYEEYAAATNHPHPGAANHPQYGSRYQSESGYAGFANTAAGNPRVAPARPTPGQMSPYDPSLYKKKGKKKAGIAGIVAAVLVLGAIGVGVYMYLNPATFNMTVNGMTRTVDNGTTVADLVSQGVVTPKPGNLIDVEGEVLEEGGGNAFDGTLNGEPISDPNTPVHKGDSVQIGNGSDKMEDYDVETIEKKPKQKMLGEGAIHVYIPGETGQVEKRTGKVSGKTAKEVVKKATDNIYFQYNANPGDEKVVALTFDDGPWPTTEELLKVLKDNDAKATFFTIGRQIADQPKTMKKMAEAGHQIATHSWDHADSGGGNGVDMTRQNAETQIEEVQKGQQAIADATGQEASKAFRSPGGNFHDDIIWTLQPYITSEIGWNIDTEDWRTPGAEAIAERIMGAKSGDIILMHDGGGSRDQTIEALKVALPYLREKGFKFVTIDELLAYDDAKALAEAAAETAAAE